MKQHKKKTVYIRIYNYNVIEQNINSFEAVWVEIKNKKAKNVLCGCVYLHPNSDTEDFNNYISKCLTIVNKEKKECYVSGDFNIDLLKYETINKHTEFLNTITSLGFLPHILQPTRITESSSTIIDNIYGNNFTQETCGGNILIKFSYHFNKKKISKVKPNAVYKRDYSNFVDTDFTDDVTVQNWNANNYNDTNSKFNDFLWRIEGCVDCHAPLKRLNKKQQKKG